MSTANASRNYNLHDLKHLKRDIKCCAVQCDVPQHYKCPAGALLTAVEKKKNPRGGKNASETRCLTFFYYYYYLQNEIIEGTLK